MNNLHIRLRMNTPLWYFFLILTSVLLGFAIVNQNYYLFLMIIGAAFFLVIIRSNIIPIAAILLIISFAGWASDQGYIPMQVLWLPELLSLLVFVKALVLCALEKRKVKLFGIWLVLPFLVITIVSFLSNSSGIIAGILFLRLLFRYYLLFLAIINLQLDEKSIKLLNNILIFIFVSQLPISVIKLMLYGQGERPLGLSSHSLPTIIPLIAIGFFLSFYYFYGRRSIYLWGIAGFIGFSIIGEKRAFILFLPILMVYFFWILRSFIKIKWKYVLIVGFTLMVTVYFSARLIYTLNPERKIWGSFSIVHLFNYGYNYTTQVNQEGLSIGRASTTKFIITRLYKSGSVRFLIGLGPGTFLKSMFSSYNVREESIRNFNVGYGINGISWLIIQVGLCGLLLFSLLFYLILKKSYTLFQQEKDPYWKSMGLGVSLFSFIMLVLCFLYSPFFLADSISSFYFCLAGFMMVRTCWREENQENKGEME